MSEAQRVVLVTGSRGFIGGHLMHAHAPGVRLVADRHGAERIDLAEFERVTELVSAVRPASIVHLAGLSDPRADLPLSAFVESNVSVSANIVEAAAQHGVERVVLAGSRHADAPNRSRYAFSKSLLLPLARYAREHLGLHATVARLGNNAGTGQSNHFLFGTLAQQFREVYLGQRTAVQVGSLDSAHDFVDVRDATTALLCMAANSFDSIEVPILTGRSTSVGDVIDLFKKYSQLDPPIESLRELTRAPEMPKGPTPTSTELAAAGWSPRYDVDHTVRWIVEQDVLASGSPAASTPA